MNSMQTIWETEQLSPEQIKNIDRNQIGDGPLTEEQEMYKENILDHFRNPRNFGKRLACSFSHKEHNPLCGDHLEFFVDVNDRAIVNIMFNGRGCAISQASASLLTEKVNGFSLDQVKSLTREQIIQMLGIPLGPVRLKCALLSLKTLLKGIEHYEQGISHA